MVAHPVVPWPRGFVPLMRGYTSFLPVIIKIEG